MTQCHKVKMRLNSHLADSDRCEILPHITKSHFPNWVSDSTFAPNPMPGRRKGEAPALTCDAFVPLFPLRKRLFEVSAFKKHVEQPHSWAGGGSRANARCVSLFLCRKRLFELLAFKERFEQDGRHTNCWVCSLSLSLSRSLLPHISRSHFTQRV